MFAEARIMFVCADATLVSTAKWQWCQQSSSVCRTKRCGFPRKRRGSFPEGARKGSVPFPTACMQRQLLNLPRKPGSNNSGSGNNKTNNAKALKQSQCSNTMLKLWLRCLEMLQTCVAEACGSGFLSKRIAEATSAGRGRIGGRLNHFI